MKTSQGKFEHRYHHIEAPTASDKERSKKVGRRVLALPWERTDKPKIWREPELEYLSRNKWSYKRKLDGENMRVMWDGEKAVWNGKSDDFVCSEETIEMMNRTFQEEIFEEKFGREKIVLLFGERMGPKCQGNELELSESTFVLFDAKVGDTWLEPKNIVSIAKYFEVPSCYDFMPGGAQKVLDGDGYAETLNGLIKKTSEGKFCDWEGVVAIPEAGLFSRKGERLIVKIKNKDYFNDYGG